MSALEVRRWRRYGHDRLYVSTRSGLRVGWVDLTSGQRQLEIPDMWAEVEAAVAQWRQEQGEATPPAPAGPVEPARPRRVPAQRVSEDLAGRRAGHNTTAIAERLQPARRSVRLLARLVGWRTRDYSWRLGAAGEAAVGGKLDRLTRRGWRVLHGISLGAGGDVDHLLIGPQGVFVVNAKHHPGARVEVRRSAVLVRGKATGYLGKAHRETERVTRALTLAAGRAVAVAPVLVFHRARRVTGWLAWRPRAVQVLPAWAVTWWCRLPGRRILSPADVEQLYALARTPATWARV